MKSQFMNFIYCMFIVFLGMAMIAPVDAHAFFFSRPTIRLDKLDEVENPNDPSNFFAHKKKTNFNANEDTNGSLLLVGRWYELYQQDDSDVNADTNGLQLAGSYCVL